MSTKVLTGTYASGYAFTSPITTVSVTASGYVGGSGLQSVGKGGSTIVNDGRLNGTTWGVYFRYGGTLTNGSVANTAASIQGVSEGASLRGGPGAVTNYGVILAKGAGGSPGVYLDSGGAVINGSVVDDVAKIVGGAGVSLRGPGGTVTNYGTIWGSYKHEGLVVAGVYVSAGAVTNGSLVDTQARIIGQNGIAFEQFTGTATVVNFGSIQSTGSSDYGVALEQNAALSLTNGAAADAGALIEGNGGVASFGAATIRNFGSIEGFGAAAISFNAGGGVTNGSVGDHRALIEGYQGIIVFGGAASIANFGTIEAVGATAGATEVGVDLDSGGSVTNGTINDKTALIEGYGGLRAFSAGSNSNFGTIQGTGGAGSGGGAYLANGAKLTNGAANDKNALIEGYVGVTLANNDTLTNFGTIVGAGGVAVNAMADNDALVVEAGSAFVGQVNGGFGTLDLASGVGLISGVSYGNVTVSGSMPTTVFYDFGTVEIGGGARFTLSGNASVTSGEVLVDSGSLSVAGTLTVKTGGALTTNGTLSGAGTLSLTGGTSTFGNGTALSIAKVTEAGAPTVANFTTAGAGVTYTGVWTQTAGTTSASIGDRVNFSGTGDSFAGTIGGAGTVAFIGGTDTFTGATLSAASVIITSAATLAGTITISHQLTVSTANLVIAATGVTFGGGGTIALTNASTNAIHGATAAAKLTNDDKILGAGQLGSGEMVLVNAASGLIDGDDSTALTINTGANAITNAGVIDAAGAGAVTIASAVDNTGVLEAAGGALTVNGAVTGTGTVKITAGTADFASTFSQNVTFTGATGVLELAHSQSYTGTVTGLSSAGTDSLDLRDIAFATASETYAGSATSGTLTVKDGTHTAAIKLVGDYTTAGFHLSKDSSGGTIVVDPRKPASPHQFIAAAASFGASGASLTIAHDSWRPPPPSLSSPRAQIA